MGLHQHGNENWDRHKLQPSSASAICSSPDRIAAWIPYGQRGRFPVGGGINVTISAPWP